MTSPHRTPIPSPRNGAGSAALVLGVVAIAFTFIPIVGDFIAIPAAIGAVIMGLIGFDRADQGSATNRRDAIVGISLGVVALLIALIVFAATQSATMASAFAAAAAAAG